MNKLIRITFFSGWTKQQVIDFALALILTVVSLIGTIVLRHIFGSSKLHSSIYRASREFQFLVGS